MAEIGFSVYVPQVEEFVKNGTHLLNMTDQEFEKVLWSFSVSDELRCAIIVLFVCQS